MGFVEPLLSFAVSFLLLGIMVYKRVSLGITLISAATVLSFLSLEVGTIANVFSKTTTDHVSISLVLATFGTMLLSQLYKETGLVKILSQSLSEILRNSKLVVSILPAIVGLLPVPGGALMSAPMVEAEANKLGLKKDRQAYVNIWFRHTIFPLYPVSQVLILTAALTDLSVTSIILRQIPVVIAMVALGYIIGLRGISTTKPEASENSLTTNLTRLMKAFMPILTMIFAIAAFSIDISLAVFLGVIVLLLITRPGLDVLLRSFRNRLIYEVTLAAFGAMLLRNVTEISGVTENLGNLMAMQNINDIVLLATIPTALAFFLGSPSGGIAISVPILAGILSFGPKNASLLYIVTYFGYLGAPTHLCLRFTADYFKCSLRRVYRYIVPSLAVSFMVAIIVYFSL
ncbi:MAG: DUF401 family protein [Candidatus Bathyarchaeota archaeon]